MTNDPERSVKPTWKVVNWAVSERHKLSIRVLPPNLFHRFNSSPEVTF